MLIIRETIKKMLVLSISVIIIDLTFGMGYYINKDWRDKLE